MITDVLSTSFYHAQETAANRHHLNSFSQPTSLFYFIVNSEEIRLGTSQTLTLTHISALKIHDLSSREGDVHKIARLILIQNRLEIQVHEKIASLDFENIAFTGTPKKETGIANLATPATPSQINETESSSEKREAFVIKTLNDDEYQELQQTFEQLLFGNQKPFKRFEKLSKENAFSTTRAAFFTSCKEAILLYVSKRFGQIIQKIQEGNQKLREEESERIAEENRKRKIKQRDKAWEQRMDRQIQKEENRWMLLKETMPPRVWNKLSN